MKPRLLSRLWQYQSERFPLAVNGVMIAVFTFSAVAYARLCREAEGFIYWKIYFAGVFCTVTLFLLVRIFDEHKDARDDAQFRPELPVPRGLVTLKELRWVAYIVVALQLLVHGLFFPRMLLLFGMALGYLCLMGVEFFIPVWLRKHPFWYVTSHMFIIPLVDVFASGLDWHLSNLAPPVGLVFFFIVSYLNGIVLEIGRKIRTPDQEVAGVQSYTLLLGTARAVWLWIGVLGLTCIAALFAAQFAGGGIRVAIVLGVFFGGCLIPALVFLRQPTARVGKWLEYTSAIWTVLMYGTLGGMPMLTHLIGQ